MADSPFCTPSMISLKGDACNVQTWDHRIPGSSCCLPWALAWTMGKLAGPVQGPLACDALLAHCQVKVPRSKCDDNQLAWCANAAGFASWGIAGFQVASWCHCVAERSGQGFKSSRWFMFTRLKGLGTSSSHAGVHCDLTFSLTSPIYQ